MSDTQGHSAQVDIDKLHDNTKTLILSTQDSNGTLETSYAPYILNQGHYYFLASSLAPRSQNIQANPSLSFLLIEDEHLAKNIFARTRLSFKASASIVDKHSDEFDLITNKLKERLGKTVALLITLKDFNLYKLIPTEGRLITGFGKAYLINCQTNKITHIDKDYLQQQNNKTV